MSYTPPDMLMDNLKGVDHIADTSKMPMTCWDEIKMLRAQVDALKENVRQLESRSRIYAPPGLDLTNLPPHDMPVREA